MHESLANPSELKQPIAPTYFEEDSVRPNSTFSTTSLFHHTSYLNTLKTPQLLYNVSMLPQTPACR